MDVTGEDDPFRSVLLWFRKRFPAFEVYGRRRVEGRGRYRGVSVSIDIERPKIKSQEQVHQIVSLKVSSPPPPLVIERLAEMVQLLAEESDQSLARIPSGVLQRFVQEAREAIEQVERHRFEEGDSVMIKVYVPLIRGEFMRHEDGESEIRIKVPMVDVRPGDREGD